MNTALWARFRHIRGCCNASQGVWRHLHETLSIKPATSTPAVAAAHRFITAFQPQKFQRVSPNAEKVLKQKNKRSRDVTLGQNFEFTFSWISCGANAIPRQQSCQGPATCTHQHIGHRESRNSVGPTRGRIVSAGPSLGRSLPPRRGGGGSETISREKVSQNHF